MVWKAEDFFFLVAPPAASGGGANRVCTRASLECSNSATTVSLRGSLFLSSQPAILYGTWESNGFLRV